MSSDKGEIEKLVDFWDEHPTIVSQLPLDFPNGASLQEYRGRCKVCDEPIEDHMLRGLITHPVSKVYVIEAVGLCTPCRTVTEFNHRVRDDLSLEWINEKGVWIRRAPRANLKTKLLKLIGLQGQKYH